MRINLDLLKSGKGVMSKYLGWDEAEVRRLGNGRSDASDNDRHAKCDGQSSISQQATSSFSPVNQGLAVFPSVNDRSTSRSRGLDSDLLYDFPEEALSGAPTPKKRKRDVTTPARPKHASGSFLRQLWLGVPEQGASQLATPPKSTKKLMKRPKSQQTQLFPKVSVTKHIRAPTTWTTTEDAVKAGNIGLGKTTIEKLEAFRYRIVSESPSEPLVIENCSHPNRPPLLVIDDMIGVYDIDNFGKNLADEDFVTVDSGKKIVMAEEVDLCIKHTGCPSSLQPDFNEGPGEAEFVPICTGNDIVTSETELCIGNIECPSSLQVDFDEGLADEDLLAIGMANGIIVPEAGEVCIKELQYPPTPQQGSDEDLLWDNEDVAFSPLKSLHFTSNDKSRKGEVYSRSLQISRLSLRMLGTESIKTKVSHAASLQNGFMRSPDSPMAPDPCPDSMDKAEDWAMSDRTLCGYQPCGLMFPKIPARSSRFDDSAEYLPLPPFARPEFPSGVRGRSPVTGISADLVLRTCFRIGEALRVGALREGLGQDAVIELFARVTFSSREPAIFKQDFRFADLFHDRPPFPKGVLSNYKVYALQESESSELLGYHGAGRMVRCLGRLKRVVAGTGWMLHILNIRATDWEEVRWTKRIIGAGMRKLERC